MLLSDVLASHSCAVPTAVWLIVAAVAVLAATVCEVVLMRRAHKGKVSWRLRLYGHPRRMGVLLLVAAAALGGARMQVVRDKVLVSWPDGPVDCAAVVTGDGVERKRSTRYPLLVNGRRVWGYVYGGKGNAATVLDNGDTLTLSRGDTLRLRHVTVQMPHLIENEDGRTFDYGRYLYCRGISGTVMIPSRCIAEVSSADLETTRKGGTLTLWFSSLRDKASQLRQRLVVRMMGQMADAGVDDAEVAGIVSALTLGDRSGIDDDLRDAYAEAGVSHVLALSGLHVGLLFGLLSFLPGLLFEGSRGRLLSLAGLVLLWAFAFLTGSSPSVVRAVLMCTIFAVTELRRGRVDALDALALTALVMMAAEPLMVFDVGFELSFVSMFALVTATPIVNRLLGGEKVALWLDLVNEDLHRVLRGSTVVSSCQLKVQRVVLKAIAWLQGAVAVALVAQAGSFPLVLHYFGAFPTYFLIGNLVVVPLMSVVMICIVLWLALSWTPLGGFAAHVVAGVVGAMNGVIRWVSLLPKSSVSVENFSMADVLVAWLIVWGVMAFLDKKPRAIFFALVGVLAMIAFRWLGI